MKLAVVGSRGFDNYEILKTVIDEIRTAYEITTIVSGGAVGADTFAEQYAEENGIEMVVFPAEWKRFGKKAGFLRNNTIWSNSDIGVAFWDGKSKGTAHSFDISRKHRKLLYVFNYTKMDFYLLNKDIRSDFVELNLNTEKEAE